MRTLSVRREELRDVPIYDGSQLRSLYLRDTFCLEGDAIAAFVAPCDVRPSGHMLDREDVETDSVITADNMLHFICEIFDQVPMMETAVLRQRLFARCVYAHLADRDRELVGYIMGDDIYLGPDWRKLTVSIATITPVSTLFHFGMNISPGGQPEDVLCSHFSDLIPAYSSKSVTRHLLDFVQTVLVDYTNELESIWRASSGKVMYVV
jgi:hypothetical protein